MGSKEYNAAWCYWKNRATLHFTQATEAGNWPCDCNQQLRERSPFCFKAEKKLFLPLFLFAVIIREASPTPIPNIILRVSGHPVAVPKAGALGGRSGAKEGGSLCAESFPSDSQIRRFLCPPFPRGRLGEAAKIWAPARSLVKKQTVFTFSKSNIPA